MFASGPSGTAVRRPSLLRITGWLLMAALWSGTNEVRLSAAEFSVGVYNVENLFDADGVAVFEDYRPPIAPGRKGYTPRHLLTKVRTIAEVIARMDGGRGPDVLLLQEIEVDQTPGPSDHPDLPALLAPWEKRSLQELLDTERLDPTVADWPAEAWLLKALEERGLRGYSLVSSDHRPDPAGRDIAHRNGVLTRLPVLAVRTHFTAGARGILEVRLRCGRHAFTVFSNHWKSGASDAESEAIRVGNARVLRERLDAIWAEDPAADVILGGDFNSQYNQSKVLPQARPTAIDEVLGARGDEKALLHRRALPRLYNLWYELPPERRGSDVFRGSWGTLMHLILPGTLYDFSGVQYIDHSFRVEAFPGLNCDLSTGAPLRWSWRRPAGAGASDHLPLLARFRSVEDGAPGRFLVLENPGREERRPPPPRRLGRKGETPPPSPESEP